MSGEPTPRHAAFILNTAGTPRRRGRAGPRYPYGVVIRLYDSRLAQLVDFEPIVPGRVGMYVCGPTVQSSPHIGHLRSALAYDLWRRWFAYRGLDVTFVRNVTDIDDKILANATAADPWWALAYRVEDEFTAAYRAIGILRPTVEPRATGYIGDMHALIATLIERGHAYAADDYFDARSWPEYGALTHQRIDDMQDTEDADPRGKRDAHDFALWKGAKPSEPADAAWDSPWGRGRPGWHIECSAMSKRFLGTEFDLHGGGLDLRFPHHENELAQSTAAGDAFARHWLHNGLVTVNGQKMSKSLGNSVFASEVLGEARPLVVRYALGAAHYRSTLDFGDTALAEAEAAVQRIEGFLDRSGRALTDGRAAAPALLGKVPEAFGEAMDDDLGIPQALAVLHDRIRAGNAAIDAGDLDAVHEARASVAGMLGVLGLAPEAFASVTGDGREHAALDALVGTLVEHRNAARAAKDFTAADRVRDDLTAVGIQLEDGPDGTNWSIG